MFPSAHGVVSQAATADTALVFDTFTGADGVSITSRPPDIDVVGDGWVALAGGLAIQGNQARGSGVAGSTAVIDAGGADVLVSASIRIQETAPQGVIVRALDSSNLYRVWLAGGALNQLRIQRIQAGVSTMITTVSHASVPDHTYRLSVRCAGTTITAYVDGFQVAQATAQTFNQTATKHGLFPDARLSLYDNFTVEDVGTNLISILYPERYQIYQRDGAGEAVVEVSGVYSGADAPAGIEIQVNGGAWSALDATPAGGMFSGTAAIPEGENAIRVRWSNIASVADSVAGVRVGDVFGWIGQSNAGGSLTNGQPYTGSLSSVRYGGIWQELSSNFSAPGTSGFSILPLLASLIEADQNVPIGFIAETENGTSLVHIGHWKKGGAQYAAFRETYNTANGAGLKAILWNQGENDMFGGVSRADYATAESLMMNDLQTDTGVNCKLISACTAHWTSIARANVDAIRLAKLDGWNNDADILPGPTGHDQAFSDGLHWKTDAEAERLAERWWRCIRAALYGGTESARGPQFSSASRSGTVVTVTFTGGEGSLQNQTDTTGWRFTDNGTPITINSAAANGTSAVDLTLASAPVGTELISFGSGNDSVGSTLSDSGANPLPPEPFVNGAVS